MNYRSATIALLAALALFRVCYILFGPFDVSPDEAHYWEWSRRLGLSYYSKGPAVAYVIAFFTSIFGNNEFGIRIGAVLFSTAASFVLFLLGKTLFKSEKAGFWSALLPNMTPIFSIGAVLMTTDVMLVFFWGAAALCVYLGSTNGRPLWWYAAGGAVGLGFLSKYTMVLIVPCLALFLLASRDKRRWFRRPEPYMAGAISLVLAAPVILWNIMHGQVTIRHTMGQAHLGEGALSAIDALEFIGAQAALLGPIVFAALVYGVWMAFARGLREKRDELMLVFFTSAPLFVFFAVKSLHGKVQANWAVAAFVTAFPAAVWAAGRLYERRRSLVLFLTATAVVMGVAASFLTYFPWLLEPLGVKKVLTGPPFNRVVGWAGLGISVTRMKNEMSASSGGVEPFIISDTYQTAGELALYVEGNPVVYNAAVGTRRMNQYDLWPGPEGLTGKSAIYVKAGDSELDPEVKAAFDRCDKELLAISWQGRPVKEFCAYRCYGFKGFEARKLENY
ncbi:MAG: glycosyltransferase family 39 protein [Deltaproteobacteria bacterium]|nr:glycosyltransferase family 39 protein [Deltaproteobacteria bacterium]